MLLSGSSCCTSASARFLRTFWEPPEQPEGHRSQNWYGQQGPLHAQATNWHGYFKYCTRISCNAAFNILLSSQKWNAVTLPQLAILIWFMLICGKGVKIQWKYVCLPREVHSIAPSFATQSKKLQASQYGLFIGVFSLSRFLSRQRRFNSIMTFKVYFRGQKGTVGAVWINWVNWHCSQSYSKTHEALNKRHVFLCIRNYLSWKRRIYSAWQWKRTCVSD